MHFSIVFFGIFWRLVESQETLFDDLCPETGKMVVATTNGEPSCVCFSEGTYEYYETCNQMDPVVFKVSAGDRCVELEGSSNAFTKSEKQTERDVLTLFPLCNKNRQKRSTNATDTPGGRGSVNITDPTDEDYLNAGKEMGHPLLRAEINQYIESVIGRLTGLHADFTGAGDKGRDLIYKKYPVLKLFDYTKKIMQKACRAVNADFFDLALNAFINLQLETFYIKEPYLSYSAYERMEMAMEKCLKKAHTHHFAVNIEGNISATETCDSHTIYDTSNITIDSPGDPDESEMDFSIPNHIRSIINNTNGDLYSEPMIETVWKMFLHAHLMCFMSFNEFFNDHHTFTVTLIHYFTNQIQTIWVQGYNITSSHVAKLYGGLFGDVGKVMLNIDHCVASLNTSPYPWMMNRPPIDKSNTWRRKRDIDYVDDNHMDIDYPNRASEDNLDYANSIKFDCKDPIQFNQECHQQFVSKDDLLITR